jgi:DNA gyrase subunit A
MAGMKLKDKATVIAAGRIDPTDVVVTVTDRGGIKLTEAGEFPAKGRATGGVRITRFKKDEQQLTHAKIGPRVGLAAATVGSDLLDSGSDVGAVNEGASKRDAPSTRTDRAFEALGWLRQ